VPDDVSVVIATHQRRDACRRAVDSALGQTRPPLEVIVVDDGSSDGTHEMLTSWAAREPRLRVLDRAPRTGRPAPPRNRGIAVARGEWVAFLDDDDAWVADKLAVQAAFLDGADLVAGNAVLDGGRSYFAAAPASRPVTRAELLRTNPIILSSSVVRRELLLRAGGMPEEPWLRGIEDYALWLALGDLGARMVVLGRPLVRYAQQGDARLSGAAVVNQLAIARLFWRRWRAAPGDSRLRRAALSKASYALTVAKQNLLAR
jgi:teichuronic acid biosynthesis glycosyltransferase TuaG